MRHPTDQETIGLILCQNNDTIVAEYALRSLQKPIGISEYELTRILPDNLKSSLPSIEEIEGELRQVSSKSEIGPLSKNTKSLVN